VYLAEPTNHVVRRIDRRTGIITTYAGTGQADYNGEGRPATATNLAYPFTVAIDHDDNLYIVDYPTRVRRVDHRTRMVTTVAGTGVGGFSGDGGPATQAQINASDVAFDHHDNMYIGDAGNERIRRVDRKSGIVTTVVGSGIAGAGPESGPAADAGFLYLISLAFGPRGALYFSDNGLNTVRRFDSRANTFETVAGAYSASPGYNGDGMPATQASLNFPTHIAIDCAVDLTISDTLNYRVRQVDAHTGIISTIAGTGTSGYGGDGGVAIQAMLAGPRGLGFAPDGSLYVVDGLRVRRITGLTGTRGWDCRDERRYHGHDAPSS
jgi:adhesin/invasin